jgi:2-phospho-L-lactate guanylyltransferase (CobY/MobA/RfbA family)
MAYPTASGMRAMYGPGSFLRHLALARSLADPDAMGTQVGTLVRRDPMAALDIDTPADLAHPLVKEVLPSWLPTNPDNRPTPPAR